MIEEAKWWEINHQMKQAASQTLDWKQNFNIGDVDLPSGEVKMLRRETEINPQIKSTHVNFWVQAGGVLRLS